MNNGDSSGHSAVHDHAGKGRLAVVFGNALEFYDFTLYAMFAPLIARQFFPADTAGHALLLALGVYGAGFLARPLGAVLLGHLADRQGRKPALLLSLALMVGGTTLLAVTPPHATIGIAAPLLVVLARLLQGLSAGGEVGASTAWLMEQGSAAQQGERLGWQIASQGMAILLGTAAATAVHLGLAPAEVERWGWRLPFLLGSADLPVGLALRRNLREATPSSSVRQQRCPLAQLLSGYRRTLVLAVLMCAGGAAQMQVMTQYLPTHLRVHLHYPAAVAYFGGATLLTAPWLGRVGDRLHRRKRLLFLSYGLAALLTIPVFALLALGAGQSASAILPGVAVLIVGMTLTQCLGAGCGLALMLEGFPRHLRASAFGIVYSMAVMLFGGLTPVLLAWLGEHVDAPLSPAYYLLAMIGFSALALWRYPADGHASPIAPPAEFSDAVTLPASPPSR